METVVTERRRARRRRTVEEHGVVSARVRPGHEVELIDVSANGALIECTRGLSPGAPIELSISAAGRCWSARGRVLRCAVVRVQPTGVSYRGAIRFDRELHWFSEHDRTARPSVSRDLHTASDQSGEGSGHRSLDRRPDSAMREIDDRTGRSSISG